LDRTGRTTRSQRGRADTLAAIFLFMVTFGLYLSTLAPSVATIFDDSLDLQLACHQLAIIHPTGYPLYALLGKLFTFLPFGDVAYRVNLLSAVAAAWAVSLIYLGLRTIVKRRLAAALGALALAVSPAFWSQAVIAEVYALNAAFTALAILSVLRWAESPGPNRSWLLLLALAMGLGLAHHRMIVLVAPALVVFILLTDRSVLGDRRLLAGMTALTLTPLLLYLYIPLRGMVTTSLDGTYLNTWQGFISHVAGSGYTAFITDNPLAQERGADFYAAAFIDQFGLPGIALGLLGFLACLRRPRVWVLLALAWATNLSFALIYNVADITVFLIPIFLLTAFWIGIGADSMASALAEAGKALNRPHVGRSLALVLLAVLLISIPGLGALNRWGPWRRRRP